MTEFNKRLRSRAVINRLRRWAACDSFAAAQEPQFRDEYEARASLSMLLAELMESSPARDWHDAFEVLREAVNHQKQRDVDMAGRETEVELTLLKDPEVFERATVRPPSMKRKPAREEDPDPDLD